MARDGYETGTIRLRQDRKTALEMIRLKTGRSINDLLNYGADLVIAELGDSSLQRAASDIGTSRAVYRSDPPKGFTKWTSQESK